MRLDQAIITALEREISEAHARLNLKKPGTMEYDQAHRIVSDMECQLERYKNQSSDVPREPQQPFIASPRP